MLTTVGKTNSEVHGDRETSQDAGCSRLRDNEATFLRQRQCAWEKRSKSKRHLYFGGKIDWPW